jgi:dTDP-4-dehydrorhamnose reductase
MTNILITGSDGFLGQHLIKHLKETTKNNLITGIDQQDDITDEYNVRLVIQTYQPNIIIHLLPYKV